MKQKPQHILTVGTLCLVLCIAQVLGCTVPDKNVFTSYSPLKYKFYPGQRVFYRCNPDYHMVGGSTTRMCSHSGRWTGKPLRCELQRREIFTCYRPNPPLHGAVQTYPPTQERFTEGESVDYNCNEGYELYGSARVYCLQGRWTHAPICNKISVITCPHRSAPANGQYAQSQHTKTTWYSREVAIFRCNRGFVLKGRQLSICTSYGQWTSPVPTCFGNVVVTTCPHRQAPKNGFYIHNLRRKTVWKVKDIATYRCDTGYLLVGELSSTCLSNNQWSSPVPVCQVTCTNRAAPTNGAYIGVHKTSWKINDVAQFTCNDGYAMSGQNSSICLSSGKWTFAVPTCKRTCPSRAPPDNGAYYGLYKKKWLINDVAKFICNDGYALSGKDRSICQLSGRWSSSVPICQRTCSHRTAPRNGGYTRTQQTKTTWYVNEVATFTCSEGFVLSGNQQSACLRSGKWSTGVPNCEVKPITCSRRSPPQNGRYTDSQRSKSVWLVKERATFVCNGGYFLVGATLSECLASGKWSTRVPVCRRSCPNRSAPANGAYDRGYKAIWFVGDIARFSCNPGYVLNGYSNSTCVMPGVWSSSVPTCGRPLTCLHRQPPRNGAYVVSQRNKRTWSAHETSIIVCNTGFIIYGASRSLCLPSGQWSAELPKCLAAQREPPVTASPTCPHRHPPLHGSYVQAQRGRITWQARDVARFQCNDGYQMVGDKRSVCSAGGLWNTDVPQCRRSCPHRSPPANGAYIPTQLTKTVWYVGDTATYRCNYGFTLEKSNSYCLNGGVWSNDVPKCKAKQEKIVCKLPRSPSNGKIRSSGQKTFVTGEFIFYECNENYRLVGESKVRCVGREWSHAPTCETTITCPHRPAPKNGVFILGGGKTIWYAGDSARFRCEDGYHLLGNNHVTCQTNAVWSAAVPTCQAQPAPSPHQLHGPHGPHVTCPHRPAPVNGVYIQDIGKTVWYVGDIARYRCNPNFILRGHDYTDCRSDGTWRFAVPTCQNNLKIFCPRPFDPAHGFVVSSPPNKSVFGNKEYITYKCKPGYVLHGNARVQCNNQKWGKAPTCHYDDSGSHGNGHGNGYGPVTTPIYPPHPIGPPQPPVLPIRGPTISGSCRNQCGAFDVGNCTCDTQCQDYFDCCEDYTDLCIPNVGQNL